MNENRRTVLFNLAAFPCIGLFSKLNKTSDIIDKNVDITDDEIIESIRSIIRKEFFKESKNQWDDDLVCAEYLVTLKDIGYSCFVNSLAISMIIHSNSVYADNPYNNEVILEVPQLPSLTKENVEKIKQCFQDCYEELEKERQRLQDIADEVTE